MASKGIVFVTGASGTIGFEVVKSLVAAGYKVIGQVRSEAKIPKLKELGVETIQSTLTEMDKLIEAAKRADAVIHTAVDYSDFAGIDSALSKALVQALGAGKKFIYTSGVWTYGDRGNDVILTEADPTPIEKSFPSGANHRCKLEDELLVLSKENNTHTIILRPVNVVAKGVGLAGGIVSLSKDSKAIRIPGPGTNYVALMHASDIGPAYLATLEKAPASSNYNIIGACVPLAEFAAGAKSVLGDVPIESIPVEEAYKTLNIYAYALSIAQRFSTEKATKELGWTAKKTTVTQLWE